MESKHSHSKSLSEDYDEEDYDIESQRSKKEDPQSSIMNIKAGEGAKTG